jgi:lipoate-protein ligase A
MQYLRLSSSNPTENLALDEALLLAAEDGQGSEVLRVWESPRYAVVLGAGGSVAIDVNVAACREDGVPILRRASGGGTVLIGPGCLCFSLVIAYDRLPGLNEIPASNRYVLSRVRQALREIAPEAAVEGTSDLTVDGRKFSGNAQQRKRRHFLHHGTLLCGFELRLISRYLNPPERRPEYRGDRSHSEFVMNLQVNTDRVERSLQAEWEAKEECRTIPWEIVRRLIEEKYNRDDWNRRR